MAHLWDDISQRVGSWTQSTTDFYQALYGLKASKTLRLVRRRDAASAAERLRLTRARLRAVLGARLRGWTDKCVVEASRNVVVKLEATSREDFAAIFAELATALRLASE